MNALITIYNNLKKKNAFETIRNESEIRSISLSVLCFIQKNRCPVLNYALVQKLVIIIELLPIIFFLDLCNTIFIFKINKFIKYAFRCYW